MLISTFNADINSTDETDRTPLHMAIDHGRNGIVYLLIEEYNQQLSHLSQEEKGKAFGMIEQYVKDHPEIIKILLEDSLQKKSLATFRGRISKGELIQMTKSNQWKVIYSNPPIFVGNQINQASPVDPKFVPYLVAVENLISRYNLFINRQDSLIKCVSLNIGDKVVITLDKHAIPSAAVVRYKGKIPSKRGIFFGIEILDEDKFGYTDGIFFNERKFACPANKGLFISIDKIQTILSTSFMLEYTKQSACGLAPSRTFKITFVGPEGSGKSSTIKTLLGKKFDRKETSTIGAVLGIQAVINWFKGSTSTENEQDFDLQLLRTVGWKEASLQDMQKVLNKEFNKEMSSTLVSVSSLEHESGQSAPGPVLQSTEAMYDSNENLCESSDEFEESSLVGKNIDTPVNDADQYSQAKNVVFGDKVDELDSHACISDFAGQQTYFSFQLFFLKKRDTIIITFNASLELTAKVIPRERYDYAKEKRVAAGMITTIENIEFWLQSVSAHAGTNDAPNGCISLRSPTAILCATHAEKLSSTRMADISKYIFKCLTGKPYANHLPTDRSKAIVFISNKKRKKFARNIIMLQQVLLEAARPAYLEERPISYLRLEQLIAVKVQEDVNMISVMEFSMLVNKAGIPGEKDSNAVTAALEYSSTRGTILYFPEVKILSNVVFISPRWLSSIFSNIITTHDQVVDNHLYRAWTRYDKFAILEEQFLDHILKLAPSASEHKEIIISLMELFNLIAEIPNGTYFTDESAPPETDKRVYIVPSLLLYNPTLPVFIPKDADQVYLFYFSELYFPESVFNQIIVKMIRWNVEKQFQIDRIQHGLGQFSLNNLQSYCLIYEPHNFTLKLCITQLDKTLSKENKRRAFDSFIELMQYLEESINSVIKLYLPCTKPPVLHVFCTECSDTNPHIMLKQVSRISLSLPILFCTKTGKHLKIPRTSYLPFGDELDDEQPPDPNKLTVSVTEMTESAVLQKFYKDLQNGFPIDDFLPQLFTKKIITITDKLLITKYGKSINERCQYFLDQCISKPILAGDPSAFYKLLQLMETSSQCIVLAARIKQCLMIGSLENKFSELCSSDTGVQKQLPQLDAFVTFYDKICKTLPVDQLLPVFVTQHIITTDEKTKIANSGKTEYERTQHFLDHYVAIPLSAGDPSFFHVLLDVMSGSPKCNLLISDIKHRLSIAAMEYQKFSDVTPNMKEIYHKYYPQMVTSLPMQDAIFISQLVKLLPSDLKGKVESKSTPAEAASCFLDYMIKPAVESGSKEPFEILLSIMEKSGNINLRTLSQSIKKEIQSLPRKEPRPVVGSPATPTNV